MRDKVSTTNYDFDVSDDAIHEFAATILLSGQDSEFMLTQGKYAYRVRGGEDGHLYYKKGVGDNWVLIANWCFYDLYIAVRYRKPLWLRPMYRALFDAMNFASVAFGEQSIQLTGKNGEVIKGRRLRLSPPSAFTEVMTKEFGFSVGEAEKIKLELKM